MAATLFGAFKSWLAIPYQSEMYFYRLFLDSVKRFLVGACRTLILLI